MPHPVFGGRPDLDQDVDALPLFITGALPNAAPLVAYEGRLQIHNAVGACQVDQIAGSVLPPGHQLYVDQDTDEIVLVWPAYSASVAPLANAGFETGNTSGWAFEYKGGTGSVAADSAYRHEGSYSLRFTGAKGLGSEGGIELSAVNNTAGIAFPNQRVTASVRGLYNPAGHNFGCRYQARLRWLDGLGATISESLGSVIKGRGNNGDWVQASVTGVAPAGTEAVKLVGWATSKGPPTWLDSAQWDLPVTIGINADTVLSLTLRVRDSAGRTAIWTGTVLVTSIDPLALSIYNKNPLWWPMDEEKLSLDPLPNRRAENSGGVGAYTLNDASAGRMLSTTGFRGVGGPLAAEVGNTSGTVLSGAMNGTATRASVIAGEDFCIFGMFKSAKFSDGGVNRTLAAKTVSFAASDTEYAIYIDTSGLVTVSFRTPGGTAFVTIPSPTTNTWHAIRAWWDHADQRVRAQIDAGTIYVSAGTVSIAPVDSEFTFGRGGIYFPLNGDSNVAALAQWGMMRGNGNKLTDDEWTWLYNGGSFRTWAELYAAAGSP